MFTVMYVLTAISIDPDFSQILRFQSTQTQCSLIVLEPFNHGQSLPPLAVQPMALDLLSEAARKNIKKEVSCLHLERVLPKLVKGFDSICDQL